MNPQVIKESGSGKFKLLREGKKDRGNFVIGKKCCDRVRICNQSLMRKREKVARTAARGTPVALFSLSLGMEKRQH